MFFSLQYYFDFDITLTFDTQRIVFPQRSNVKDQTVAVLRAQVEGQLGFLAGVQRRVQRPSVPVKAYADKLAAGPIESVGAHAPVV